MRRILIFSCILFALGTPFYFKPIFFISQAAEEAFDLEEVKMHLIKPGFEQIKKKNLNQLSMLARKEVKFVAGKDDKWFTADDEVYHYFLAEYSGRGRMTKKNNYSTGEDKIPFTADDKLQEYWVYEYSPEGRPLKETFYKVTPSNKNIENYHALYETNARGRKIKTTRYKNGQILSYVTYTYGPNGKVVRDAEYTASGPDGKWFSADDEVEKYHMHEYSKDGRLTRAMEYHVTQQGSGPDGKWFSADDVISSTRVFFYNGAGFAFKVHKCVGAGVDNTWFSADDLLQYYTLRYL